MSQQETSNVVSPAPSPASNGVQCSNQPAFEQCNGNYQATGGVVTCDSYGKNTNAQYQCLCKQYFATSYCFNNFCPQDANASQLNMLRAQYCGLVPTFDPNPTGSYQLLPTGNAAVNGNNANGNLSQTASPLALPKGQNNGSGSMTPNFALAAVFLAFLNWI
ncbi:hypothetical protein HDU99_006577 [Rhizoclosmatium hyalinum]|nr:hypothetical protein HDU99_006577 [Rhizoclosmatium hyalinum]